MHQTHRQLSPSVRRSQSGRTNGSTRRSSGRSKLPGILLGSILLIFSLAFIYSGFLFYQWMRAAVPAEASITEGLLRLVIPEAVFPVDPAVAVPDGSAAPIQVPTQPTWDADGRERINVLVLGIDTRSGDPTPARTDTVIVLTLDPVTGKVGMVSLPRDLWVPIPEYNMTRKINTAHVLGESLGYPGGGPALAKRTVSEFLGYPIHYYVRLNFEGFEEVINLIGGIELDVPQTIDDPMFPDDNYGYDPLYIPAGRHVMDGELALKYARTRHVDDDYGRARRQQQVVMAVKEKVLRLDMIPTLVMRAPLLAKEFAQSVQTNMPIEQATKLAELIRHLDLSIEHQVVLDREFGVERYTENGAFILIPDQEEIAAALEEVFAPPSPEEVASAVHQQSFSERARYASIERQVRALHDSITGEGARVLVLNGTQTNGLAASTRSWLREHGFNVVEIGDAGRSDYERSVILEYNPRPATTEALQLAFNIKPENYRPGTTRRSEVDLVLILGADYPPFLTD